MDDRDDIRNGLNEAAASIDVGDLELARADAHHTSSRRRRRVRVGSALGAVVAIVAAAGIVVAVSASDEPDTLVTADLVETTPPTTDESVDSTIAAQPTAGTRTVEVIDRPGVVGSNAGTNGAPEYSEWLVPWRDGFLAGSTRVPPQPLPDKLPDEVVALFPQEVTDLFGGNLPATIDEATRMLSEAGLLDEVTAVIRENPEASEAIYGAPNTAAPALDARFTTDGVTWEPVEVTLPAGATYLSGVATVGDRLVVSYVEQEPTGVDGGTDRFSVATTTDLTTWGIQEIVAPPLSVELPAGVVRGFNTQGLAVTESGWAVTAFDSVQPDALGLVRAAGLEPPGLTEANGFGVGIDPTGIEIQYGDDSETASQTIRFTWEELGISPEVAALLTGQGGNDSQVWSSTWDGVARAADVPSAQGQLLATSAGFLQFTDRTWFSPDGFSWTPSDLPDPDGHVITAFVSGDGVIALSTGSAGSTDVFRLDATGANSELLDVTGLPSVSQFGFYSQAAPGSAMVFDGGQPPTQSPLIVEVDGYRLSSENAIFELTDLATGEVIVSEDFSRRGPDDNSNFDFGLDGITVTDPASGDVLVVVANDVLEQAEQNLFGGSSEVQYTPDLWLIGSADGERFVVVDLDDGDGFGGPIVVATNGNRALVLTGDRWTAYDMS